MKKLTENVTLMGNRHFNLFLVGNKEAAIIECGVSGGVASLSEQWDRLYPKPDVKFLLVMHAHFDHVCGIPRLKQQFPGARVLACQEARKVLANNKIMQDFFQQDEKMSELLLEEGILAKKPEYPLPESLDVDHLIREGDSISLGSGLELEVLAVPGHSPCSMAAYLRQDEIMFLSDAAGFQISDKDIFPIFFQGYEMYMESIKRLMTYPTQILGIPHERIWVGDEVPGFYQRALDSARTIFHNIEKMLDDGVDEDSMKKELFFRYYRGDLRIYTPENIKICLDLLIRRVKECL